LLAAHRLIPVVMITRVLARAPWSCTREKIQLERLVTRCRGKGSESLAKSAGCVQPDFPRAKREKAGRSHPKFVCLLTLRSLPKLRAIRRREPLRAWQAFAGAADPLTARTLIH
jgi:hypothetical protein